MKKSKFVFFKSRIFFSPVPPRQHLLLPNMEIQRLQQQQQQQQSTNQVEQQLQVIVILICKGSFSYLGFSQVVLDHYNPLSMSKLKKIGRLTFSFLETYQKDIIFTYLVFFTFQDIYQHS